jgi:gamma-glutamyltranspeptidase
LGLLYFYSPSALHSTHVGIGGNPAYLIKVGGTLSVLSNSPFICQARNGAVATENIICSNVGVDILKAGAVRFISTAAVQS